MYAISCMDDHIYRTSLIITHTKTQRECCVDMVMMRQPLCHILALYSKSHDKDFPLRSEPPNKKQVIARKLSHLSSTDGSIWLIGQLIKTGPDHNKLIATRWPRFASPWPCPPPQNLTGTTIILLKLTSLNVHLVIFKLGIPPSPSSRSPRRPRLAPATRSPEPASHVSPRGRSQVSDVCPRHARWPLV